MTTSLLGRRQGLLLAGTPSGGGAPASPLLTDLVSYWKLDEASGNATDAHGTNHLTDVNTVTTAAGKQGTARQFTAANAEYFTIASNASVQTGDIDFTVAAWVYLDSAIPYMGIAGKWLSPNADYLLLYDATGFFGFAVSGGAYIVTATTLGAPALSTWYFVVGWHDSVGDTLNIQVNNGLVDAVPHTAGVTQTGGPFVIGNDNAVYWNGRIDEVGLWRKCLSSDERATLWAGGAGSTYPWS